MEMTLRWYGSKFDTVLKVRIPNPFMPDTPQRMATDTSQKSAR